MRSLHDVPNARIAQVCDRDRNALERIARRYPALATTTSVDEVLEDSTIDAVVIATPVSTHYDLAMAGLRAGKHVLVEKPLAASLRQSVELVDEAHERGLVLMPGHTFLYSPPVMLVHDLIDAGELGDVYFVSSSRVNLGLHQPDVSVIWDLGPHDFSILRYWLGERPLYGDGDGTRVRRARYPGRGLRQPRVPVRRDRARRAVLARAKQAASDDRGRLAEDAGLRRHQLGAGAGVRRRRVGARPAHVRRVPDDATAPATSCRPGCSQSSRCTSSSETSATPCRRVPSPVRMCRLASMWL